MKKQKQCTWYDVALNLERKTDRTEFEEDNYKRFQKQDCYNCRGHNDNCFLFYQRRKIGRESFDE